MSDVERGIEPDAAASVDPRADAAVDQVADASGSRAEIGVPADESTGVGPLDVGSPPDSEAAAGALPTVKPGPSDLAPTLDAAALPGAHRGGFSRELTGPVAVTIQSAPIEPGTEDGIDYTPADWVQPPSRAHFAPWALGFSITGLLVSLLVGWGFLLGVVAIIAGVVALRRRDGRAMAIWAICLAAVSIVYSAGWILFAASQGAFTGR